MNQREEFVPQENSQEFAELERQLAEALQRVDPPVGFADRVMGRVDAEPVRAKVISMVLRPRIWMPSAIAAVLLLGAFGVHESQMRQEHKAVQQAKQAQQAQQQFEAAMQITGETMDQVRQQLQQAGVTVGD